MKIWTMVRKSIKVFLVVEMFVLATYIYEFKFFINLQVAFLSSFFVMFGSMLAYRKMVIKKVETKSFEDKKDLVDELTDPHELFEDESINEAPAEELDLKQIVKEEKKKIKTLDMKSLKEGGGAGFSPFRLVPYLFLILGFIALKNNNLLEISIYLPSLLVGIFAGASILVEDK